MDAAEVQCRFWHAELRVVELTLPLRTQAAQLTHDILHGLQRTVAKSRIGGMATLPKNIDALHHHALVQAYGLEACRLANHCSPAKRSAGSGQGTGAGHRAFFVTGGENQQRLLEGLIEQRSHGLDGQDEEALHVATAEAHPAVAHFAQLERVGLPQGRIEGHGIAVPSQHQTTRAGAITGEQVELAGAICWVSQVNLDHRARRQAAR